MGPARRADLCRIAGRSKRIWRAGTLDLGHDGSRFCWPRLCGPSHSRSFERSRRLISGAAERHESRPSGRFSFAPMIKPLQDLHRGIKRLSCRNLSGEREDGQKRPYRSTSSSSTANDTLTEVETISRVSRKPATTLPPEPRRAARGAGSAERPSGRRGRAEPRRSACENARRIPGSSRAASNSAGARS